MFYYRLVIVGILAALVGCSKTKPVATVEEKPVVAASPEVAHAAATEPKNAPSKVPSPNKPTPLQKKPAEVVKPVVKPQPAPTKNIEVDLRPFGIMV